MKRAVLIISLLALSACDRVEPVASATPAATAREPVALRCAVIGGMTDTQLWQELAVRYTAATGNKLEIIATGPKEQLSGVVVDGAADVVTMHASDTIINLVADGYALDPQPWLRNDQVIVGPTSDPAGIRGETDAAKAMQKISDSGARFVVHSGIGTQEVLHAVMQSGGVEFNQTQLIYSSADRKRLVLELAATNGAYTLVGRIPFLGGKMPNPGLQIMVQGDPRLRRPYLIAPVDPQRVPSAHLNEARQLVEFVRSSATQNWIRTYGVGRLDDKPLFFPIAPFAGSMH